MVQLGNILCRLYCTRPVPGNVRVKSKKEADIKMVVGEMVRKSYSITPTLLTCTLNTTVTIREKKQNVDKQAQILAIWDGVAEEENAFVSNFLGQKVVGDCCFVVVEGPNTAVQKFINKRYIAFTGRFLNGKNILKEPKHVGSAQSFYCSAKAKTITGVKFDVMQKQVKDEWSQMSDDDKQVFIDQRNAALRDRKDKLVEYHNVYPAEPQVTFTSPLQMYKDTLTDMSTEDKKKVRSIPGSFKKQMDDKFHDMLKTFKGSVDEFVNFYKQRNVYRKLSDKSQNYLRKLDKLDTKKVKSSDSKTLVKRLKNKRVKKISKKGGKGKVGSKDRSTVSKPVQV